MNSRSFGKIVCCYSAFCFYTLILVRYAGAPPLPPGDPPATPVWNEVINLLTVGGIAGYGLFRLRK